MTLNISKTTNHLGQPTFDVTGNTSDLLRLLVKTTYNAAMWIIIMKMTMSVTPVAALELALGTDAGAGMTNPPLTFPESSRSFVEGICNSLQSSPTCNIV